MRTSDSGGSFGRRARSDGQGLVEFAVVLPILALFLFGTVQFGLVFGSNVGLVNAAREGARLGAVCTGTLSTCANDVRTRTLAAIPAFPYTDPPTTCVEYSQYQDAAGKYNVRIRVTATANAVIFFPVIGAIIHPTAPSQFPLTTNEVFRVEGQPKTSPLAAPPNDGQWHAYAGC